MIVPDNINSIDFKSLPDDSKVRYILKTIIKIIDFMRHSPILKNLSKEEKENILFNEFPDFSKEYFNMFQMIINEEIDTNTLITILKFKAGVEKGIISGAEADKYIDEFIAEKYLYPSFGGKEGYEEKVKEAQEMMNRKQRRNAEFNNKETYKHQPHQNKTALNRHLAGKKN